MMKIGLYLFLLMEGKSKPKGLHVLQFTRLLTFFSTFKFKKEIDILSHLSCIYTSMYILMKRGINFKDKLKEKKGKEIKSNDNF